MIFNPSLEEVESYEAGKPIEFVMREFGIEPSNIIKLASNENPYGCSPLVKEMVAKEMRRENDIASMYPDDSYYELKKALSSHYDVSGENIIIGCGSDQVIDFCIRARCNSASKILIAGITFAMYEIYAKMNGTQIIRTPSITHNLDEFKTLYQEHKPDMVFLCLPNNPLGESVSKTEVYDFIASCDENTLVVVDGAYQDYASHRDSAMHIEPKKLINTFANTIYLGTFSKAYALGGMRVGYGLSNEGIIKTLHKLRPPFNITNLSLRMATLALQDQAHVQKCIVKNFEEMNKYEQFCEDKKIGYIKSYTNFITIAFDDAISSKNIAQKLLREGVIVRDLSSYQHNAIRVTIGQEWQNEKVISYLRSMI